MDFFRNLRQWLIRPEKKTMLGKGAEGAREGKRTGGQQQKEEKLAWNQESDSIKASLHRNLKSCEFWCNKQICICKGSLYTSTWWVFLDEINIYIGEIWVSRSPSVISFSIIWVGHILSVEINEYYKKGLVSLIKSGFHSRLPSDLTCTTGSPRFPG